jgi:hypothetical protein
MLNYWVSFLTGLGFVFVLHDYLSGTMPGTLGNTIVHHPIVWNGFKLFAVSKKKAEELASQLYAYIYRGALEKNMLFIQDGVRAHTVAVGDNTEKIQSIINDKNDYDLVLYRNPSPRQEVDYDIVRLSDENIKEICGLGAMEEYTCDYKIAPNKILNPVLYLNREPTEGTEKPGAEKPDAEKPDTEKPDTEKPGAEKPDTEKPDAEKPGAEGSDAEEPDSGESDAEEPNASESDTECGAKNVFGLSLEDDNYYIDNNKLFDKSFISWLLREQHNKILESVDKYSVHYFDTNMDQHKIGPNEFIHLHDGNVDICLATDNIDMDTESEKKKKTDAQRDAEGRSWGLFF